MNARARDMLVIDGSQGEGGGQVVRTSLALSLVTGSTIRIEGIRAGRSNPGLRRQHLTAVAAAARVGRARVEGASIGSPEIVFAPTRVTPGRYRFSVGTAGSATLVLQTVLPALAIAPAPSRLVIEGGTHNLAAPPFDFVEKAFLPVIERMGPRIRAVLERAGFYPAGGGRIRVEIEPRGELLPVEIVDRGRLRRTRARAVVSALPPTIADRELAVLRRRLGWKRSCFVAEEIDDPVGPGNVVMIEMESEALTEVMTGFGARGVRAEEVAKRAASAAQRYLDSGAPVGPHLADQLLLPFALARGGKFRTLALTRHATTNIEVIRRFLPVEIRARRLANDLSEITIEGSP